MDEWTKLAQIYSARLLRATFILEKIRTGGAGTNPQRSRNVLPEVEKLLTLQERDQRIRAFQLELHAIPE
ncbi:MAG TPA: hypothetical protein VIM61_05400, partial [Chthoniobacterales bacterium]